MKLTMLCETTMMRSRAVRPCTYDENFQELVGVEVVRLQHVLGPKPAEAVLELTLDSFHREVRSGAVGISERRKEFLQNEGAPMRLDRLIWIGLPLDGNRVLLLFCGRVTDETVEFSGASGSCAEKAYLVARDVRHELEGKQVLGQHFHDESEGRRHVDLPTVLNPNGCGNRDASHVWQEGDSAPLFAESGPDSADWNAADALKYLLGHYGLNVNLQLPTDALHSDVLSASLPETVLETESCAQAMWKVLRDAHLDAWVDPVIVTRQTVRDPEELAPSLHLINPITAPVRNPKLSAAGTTFSSESCELRDGKVDWSSRRIRNQWRVQGALRKYEARFELVELWTADEESAVSDNTSKGRRGHEAYDPKLDHVYRQWGLNEDGHWSDQSTYDFSDLFSGAVPRRRVFLPPFRNPEDEVRPIVVEVQSDSLPEGWHRIGNAAVRLLSDRAGIYFDCEDVDGKRSGLQAGSSRQFVTLEEVSKVRLSAVIQSDERVIATSSRAEESGTELVLEHTVIDESFHRRTRDDSSIYSDDGTGEIEDDSTEDGPMQRRADALRQQHEGLEVHAKLTIPWIDPTWRPGVRVGRLAGCDIDLCATGGDDPGYPLVAGVSWDFSQQTTTLTLKP